MKLHGQHTLYTIIWALRNPNNCCYKCMMNMNLTTSVSPDQWQSRSSWRYYWNGYIKDLEIMQILNATLVRYSLWFCFICAVPQYKETYSALQQSVMQHHQMPTWVKIILNQQLRLSGEFIFCLDPNCYFLIKVQSL